MQIQGKCNYDFKEGKVNNILLAERIYLKVKRDVNVNVCPWSNHYIVLNSIIFIRNKTVLFVKYYTLNNWTYMAYSRLVHILPLVNPVLRFIIRIKICYDDCITEK